MSTEGMIGPVVRGVPDAWRCEFCNILVYWVDIEPQRKGLPKKVPKPGAPVPRYVSGWGNLCSLCAHLFWTIQLNEYFRKIQDQYEKELGQSKRNLDKLRPGNDYFHGMGG